MAVAPRCNKVKYTSKKQALAVLRKMPIERLEHRVYICAKHNKTYWHLTGTMKR